MNFKYGISIHKPDETVFGCGLFDCVEYCGYVDFRPFDSFERFEAEVDELCRLSQKYNVRVRSYHLPFADENDGGTYPFTPASLSEDVRKFTMNNTKKLINYISKCGIKYVVLHGSKKVTDSDRPQKLDLLVEYIKELCDFCAPLGITVALETLKPTCLGRTLAEHLYVMEKANRQNLGICFDSNHLLGEDNINFLSGAGQYVVTTHLSDYDGIDERHWFPGRGINNWQQIVSLLRQKGYNGPFVFEVGFKQYDPTLEELHTLVDEWEKLIG